MYSSISHPALSMSSPAAAAMAPVTADEKEWMERVLNTYAPAVHWLLRVRLLTDADFARLRRVCSSDEHRSQLDIRLDGETFKEVMARLAAEQERRDMALKPLPGGLPHFPIQAWERDTDEWLRIQSRMGLVNPHNLVQTRLVDLYQERVRTQYPAIWKRSKDDVTTSAIAWAHRHKGNGRVAFRVMLTDLAARDQGPGTPKWHYVVERMEWVNVEDIVSDSAWSLGVDNHLNAGWQDPRYQLRLFETRTLHAGLSAELARLRTAVREVRARSDFAQSGALDWLTSGDRETHRPSLPTDIAQMVGSYYSGRIQGRHTPGVRSSGPVRSNIDVRRQIAAQAAQAAAQPVDPQTAAAELARRRTAAQEGRARSDFVQAGVLDWLTSGDPETRRPSLPNSIAQMVGSYHSGYIQERRIPGVHSSGPVRSNLEVLREIAAQAAQAAAQPANPQAAVQSLQRVASELGELSESIAKRGKH